MDPLLTKSLFSAFLGVWVTGHRDLFFNIYLISFFSGSNHNPRGRAGQGTDRKLLVCPILLFLVIVLSLNFRDYKTTKLTTRKVITQFFTFWIRNLISRNRYFPSFVIFRSKKKLLPFRWSKHVWENDASTNVVATIYSVNVSLNESENRLGIWLQMTCFPRTFLFHRGSRWVAKMFSFPSSPRAFFLPSLQPSHDTKRPLQRRGTKN